MATLAPSALAMPCGLNSGTFSTAGWQIATKSTVQRVDLVRCHHCLLAQRLVELKEPLLVVALAQSALAKPGRTSWLGGRSEGWSTTLPLRSAAKRIPGASTNLSHLWFNMTRLGEHITIPNKTSPQPTLLC